MAREICEMRIAGWRLALGVLDCHVGLLGEHQEGVGEDSTGVGPGGLAILFLFVLRVFWVVRVRVCFLLFLTMISRWFRDGFAMVSRWLVTVRNVKEYIGFISVLCFC